MSLNSRRVLWNAISVLVVAFLLVLTVMGQDSRQLYLVTGLAANNAFPVGVPSTLLSIDETKPAAIKLLDITGGTAVIADHDRRLVVIGDFGHQLTVLKMDSPLHPTTIPTNFGPQFLCTPPNALFDQGCVNATALERRLLGIDLTGPEAGRQSDLPFDYFRFVRTEGYWSPIDLSHNHIFLALKNGKLLFNSNDATTDLGIPLPADSASLVTARDISLAVSTDDMVVLDCYRMPSPDTETHSFQIYDRKSKTWQTADLDAGPSIRGFGPWIATASFIRKRPIGVPIHQADLKGEPESPGAASRKRILNPEAREREQTSLDTLFQQIPFQFTGDLYLYNIRSRQSLMIRTGQGDSEILLVDGNTVYYRVNDTLYRASIQNGRVEPVEILTHESVQMAHWAFLGPRSGQ